MSKSIEHKRQVQINGIRRNYDFVKSHHFREASKATLLLRKSLTERNYTEFQMEYCSLVEKMPSYKFKELDDMCGFVEGQYVEIMTAIEERLKILRDAERKTRERECENISTTNESANVSANVLDQKTENYNRNEFLVQIVNENANQNEDYQEDGNLSANIEENEERAIAKNNRKRVKKGSTHKSKIKRAKKERDSETMCEEKSSDECYQENETTMIRSAVVPVANENDNLEQQPDLRERLNRLKVDAREFLHDAERFRQEVLQVEHGNTTDNNSTNMHEINHGTNQRANQSANQRMYNDKPPLSCYYCHASHALSKCERFLRLKIRSRWNAVAELNLCPNCFIPRHLVASPHHCRYGNCRQCHQFHNSTLCDSQLPSNRFTPRKRYTGYYAR